MLLYNHKQEFIGIDDEGLKLLNYPSFEELLKVCTDVADLFANEPGYIYNFKNFGWIDFILHSDSDTFNAIVHAKGRVFSCQLAVSQFYLVEYPTQSGYRIELLHIKTISGEDIKPHVITPRERPKEPVKEFIPPRVTTTEPSVSPFVNHTHITPIQLNEPAPLDIPLNELSEPEELYSDFEEPLPFIPEMTEEPKPVIHPAPKAQRYSDAEKEYLSHHKVANNYLFDPSVAANELGLPVDLIEEFIGDFIQQSHEFKNELFDACAKNDFNNIHILSHKLKGVAANLRIEDALETLTIINTSTDVGEIEVNLKYYYTIVAKLEGKEGDDVAYQPTVQTDNFEMVSPTQTTPKTIGSDPISLEETDTIYAFAPKEHKKDPEVLEEIPYKKEFFDLGGTEPELEVEPIKEVETRGESSTDNPVTLHYDIDSTARALGIEIAFMQELISDYKYDANIISSQISDAISAFDTVLWNENASKLKGISDNLRLSEVSDELNVLIKTHDAQEAKKASSRLMSYLDQL